VREEGRQKLVIGVEKRKRANYSNDHVSLSAVRKVKTSQEVEEEKLWKRRRRRRARGEKI